MPVLSTPAQLYVIIPAKPTPPPHMAALPNLFYVLGSWKDLFKEILFKCFRFYCFKKIKKLLFWTNLFISIYPGCTKKTNLCLSWTNLA